MSLNRNKGETNNISGASKLKHLKSSNIKLQRLYVKECDVNPVICPNIDSCMNIEGGFICECARGFKRVFSENSKITKSLDLNLNNHELRNTGCMLTNINMFVTMSSYNISLCFMRQDKLV